MKLTLKITIVLMFRLGLRLCSFRLGRLVFLILFQFILCTSFAVVDYLFCCLEFASPKVALLLILPENIKTHISGLVTAFTAVSFFFFLRMI